VRAGLYLGCKDVSEFADKAVGGGTEEGGKEEVIPMREN